MQWWIATVVCSCAALLFQYLCSTKLLRMKQQISLNNISLRDARLEEQAKDLTNQQKSLTHSIGRLRGDMKRMRAQIQDKGLPIPEPDFSLDELEAGDKE